MGKKKRIPRAKPVSRSESSVISRRLIQEYVRPHKRIFIRAGIFMALSAACTAIHAWMMQPVLDDVFLNAKKEMLIVIPLVLVVVTFIKGFSSYQYSHLLKIVSQRIAANMQMNLFRHHTESDIAFFNEHSSGKLISQFMHDIEIIRRNISVVMLGLARETITLIFLVGVMFYQSWELSLIAFVAFPLAIYPLSRLGKRMRKISRNVQSEWSLFSGTLDDVFKGIRIVKAYGQEKREVARAETRVEALFKHYAKAAQVDSISSPIMEILAGCAIAAVIWYGGSSVIAGETTPGAFFSFNTALLMAYRPIKSLSKLNNNLQEGLAAVQEFYTAIDSKATVQNSPTALPLMISDSSIIFDTVSFSYGDKLALDRVSFTVPSGKRVALVGESGSGKSTIMNLLLRFFDPVSGEIRIGETDIKIVTMESLRKHMAIVTQDTFLFDDTVRANICYGVENPTEEAMIQAAKDAAAHEFILKMEHGYDTMIGPHGVKVSGGQRQRISIARAMLRNSPILLLDEATSALDAASEAKVQEALDRLMQGRTSLVIAHRLSTIMHADIIYVLEQGRVVESGSHKTLIKQGGVYASLYAKQAGVEGA